MSNIARIFIDEQAVLRHLPVRRAGDSPALALGSMVLDEHPVMQRVTPMPYTAPVFAQMLVSRPVSARAGQ